jgi:hypothetical protein
MEYSRAACKCVRWNLTIRALEAASLALILIVPTLSARTWYVAPAGSGNGSSAFSPLGTFSAGMNASVAGDTLLLLDGEYTESLVISKSGTSTLPITIMAQTVGGVFINGQGARIPVTAYQKSYVNIDGIRAGNSSEYVYHILYCDHFRITRCAGFNAGGALDDNANFHIFEIAYSTNMFAEDIWAWGTGRYSFVYYGCTNCLIRRAVLRPGLFRRCPHAGLAIYCTDSSLAENVLVFEARVDPASGYGGTAPWQLITGGFVCEGHDCPGNKSSGPNRMLGCMGIDNGQHWNVVPRSQPARCFIWNEYRGSFEDWVLWKNPDKAFAAFTDSSTRTMPARSLEGDPANVVRNTQPDIVHRYIDGALSSQPLWPWPYEDLIKRDLNMTETITEYVCRQLSPYIVIPGTADIHDDAPRMVYLKTKLPSDAPVRAYSLKGNLLSNAQRANWPAVFIVIDETGASLRCRLTGAPRHP